MREPSADGPCEPRQQRAPDPKGNSEGRDVHPGRGTPEEVAVLLGLASPRVELHVLLMLNCAVTQQEVADIQAGAVDWTAGRIRWSRTKTKRHAPPTINYRLWDRTWELLQQFAHREGTVVRKEDGSPLITKTVRYHDDGSYRDVRRADSVVSNWRHLERRAKRDQLGSDWKKPLKAFRKTGASLLESSDHAEFVDMHLDHKRVARQHYLKPGQVVPRFDDAIRWLGQQFGLLTETSSSGGVIAEVEGPGPA